MLYYFYRIVCKDLEIKDCYIGSTKNLERRIAKHRSNCNSDKSKSYNLKIYQFIRNNGGWKNWNIILIEKLEFDNKFECLQNERKLIESYNSNLNSNIPGRTLIENEEYKKNYRIGNNDKIKECQKEYRIENKDKIKEILKKYRIKNIDKIKEYQKEYIIENKDKIKECQKEYRIENKDKIKEYQKEYRIENKDKIKENKIENKEYQKEYRIENKDKMKEYKKEYYIKNKNKNKILNPNI
jgi:hypothetical protein